MRTNFLNSADAQDKRSVDGLFTHLNGNMSIHLSIDCIVYHRQEAVAVKFWLCYYIVVAVDFRLRFAPLLLLNSLHSIYTYDECHSNRMYNIYCCCCVRVSCVCVCMCFLGWPTNKMGDSWRSGRE